ncbi:MAG TPA: NAD(P)H-binding protein [Stenotrophomonas sp.]|nr:NAD(P)H-binding protein [Stenotrophomonas sp.]
MRILLAGATGLVGSHTLSLLLDDPRCTALIAPTRRPLGRRHPKLDNPVLDFDDLEQVARGWSADAAICALGTTIAIAGSREVFRRVDHDYPLALATALRAQGTRVFVLNSAMGADVRSWFLYSRVKGELERDLRALRFDSLVLVRPGLIGGERAAPRKGERIASTLLGSFAPVLPRAWRINPAPMVARAMVDRALQPVPGERVIGSAELIG